jgi:hypothetical protein
MIESAVGQRFSTMVPKHQFRDRGGDALSQDSSEEPSLQGVQNLGHWIFLSPWGVWFWPAQPTQLLQATTESNLLHTTVGGLSTAFV